MIRYRNGIVILLVGLLISVAGCEDRVLNQEPAESFTEQDVWNDIELVKKYVWNNYNAFGKFGESSWALSDNTYPIFYPGVKKINQGNLSPNEMGEFSDDWEENYEYIRNANIFLQRIDEVEGDPAIKKRLTGEMKFIRAFSYAQLLDLFGGVPIITKPFKLNEDFKEKRAPYKEGINWVVKELDEASKMVPESVSADDFGRVTKGAVLALKSQVLLYAASKLHDLSTDPSGPLYDYDVSTKWKDAADAAQAVIDMGQYSLVSVDDWKDYQLMFLHNTPEIIFARPFSPEYSNMTSLNVLLTPNGYNGWSASTPTQDLVDDFQMKDGKSIDESPLYNPDPDLIYKNRELRFYADIVYQGADYRGRKTEFYLPGGLDSKDGPAAHNYAVTGYTVRKYMDETINIGSELADTPSIFFRLTEIYLNYAEAQYHLKKEGIAREYVNKIRKRVHLPDISSSGPDLLKDIQRERRIELSFEGFHGYRRYSDLRRWMLAEQKLNENTRGIEWKKVNGQGELSADGDLTYNMIDVLDRKFTQKMYYVPIPLSEIEKTDLKQNTGY